MSDCCGVGHQGHRQSDPVPANIDTARDPVCGGLVSVAADTPQSIYYGRTYYFRTPNCRQEFEAEPGRYIRELAARQFTIWL